MAWPVPVVLPVQRWGSGGSTALLVHGLSSTAGGWWRVADALAARGMSVVAPDLRGHGDAPTPARYRLVDMAADLVGLGDRWDVVVGHSLGGAVAVELARHVPVGRLVLLDPVLVLADLDAVEAQQLAELDPSADPAALLAANPRWHELDARHKAEGARRTAPWVVRRCLRDNAPWDHVDRLPGVLAQEVVLVTADPAVGTLCPGPVVARAIGHGARHVVADGCGHGIHREDPGLVVGVAAGAAQPSANGTPR